MAFCSTALRAVLRAVLAALLLLFVAPWAHAALADIAEVPLPAAGGAGVLPNLTFILDDSSSMNFDYLPDHVNSFLCRETGANSGDGPYAGRFGRPCCHDAGYAIAGANACYVGLAPFGSYRGHPPYMSSGFNGVYYNPATTYQAPPRGDGSLLPSQTAAATAGWSRVPNDAYRVQNDTTVDLLTQFPDSEWCTDGSFTDCLRNDNYVLPATVQGRRYETFHATTAQGTGRVATGAPDAADIAPRTFGPHHYAMVAGEFCDDLDLRRCRLQRDATYAVPALVRWCDTGDHARALQPPDNSCRAVKSDRFTEVRYPTVFYGAEAGFPGGFRRVDIVPGATFERAPTRSDCTDARCSYEEEMTNFANWWAYYRTRMQAMKTATAIAFAPSTDALRVGYLTINNGHWTDFINLDTFSGAHKTAWYAQLRAAEPRGSTPLRRALTTVGRLYAGRYDGQELNHVPVSDPLLQSCQANVALLSTDGYWNEGENPKQLDGSTDIGDQDADLPRPAHDGRRVGNTLADVAAYYAHTDLRDPALGNCIGANGRDVCANDVPPVDNDTGSHQHMRTFGLGLGAAGAMQFRPDYLSAPRGDYASVRDGADADPASGVCAWQAGGVCEWPVPQNNAATAVDDLWHAAVNGHGTYFSAYDPASLLAGLQQALQQARARRGAGAAAAISTLNPTAGDRLVVISQYESMSWSGDLLARRLGLDGGTPSDAASDWSAAQGLDAQAERRIYTFDAAAPARLKPLAWDRLGAAEQALFRLPHIGAAAGGLSQFCEAGPACLPPAAQAAGAGEKLLSFLLGDRSHEGPATDPSTYFRQRTHRLGDIAGSQAAIVQGAAFDHVDPGYAEFKAAAAQRPAAVYVGANDGMLHAFDAATGEELWAYVPALLLPKLHRLADKDYANRHAFFVDGSPTTADVFFDGAWHTVLVCGLGAGGRGWFALDITDPRQPRALWEFTDPNMGLSFGQAEISKLASQRWVAVMGSGHNNVQPGDGRGRLYIIDVATGQPLRTIATDAGDTATPAGLAAVRAWVDNAEADNTMRRTYGADLLGNVWRFDVEAGTAVRLALLRDAEGRAQPVTAKPELGSVDGRPMVYVGTGRYLGAGDVGSSGVQSMYAIRDALTAAPTPAEPRAGGSGFVHQVLADAPCPAGSRLCRPGETVRTVAAGTAANDAAGWYLDLPAAGERIAADPQLAQGTLVFSSSVATASGTCSAGGSSRLNYVDYRSGAAVPGSDGVAGAPLGDAVAAQPVVYKLPSGQVFALTRLADTGSPVREVPVAGSFKRPQRLLWRELGGD